MALLAAAVLCAGCLGLAACGGSSGSSSAASSPESASASASAASASESASTSAASASTASASAAANSTVSASAAAASSETASEVTPELKEAAENLVALADEEVALVEKAKASSFDAVEEEWNDLSSRLDEATAALKPWAQKYSSGELSDADKSYYMKVAVPAASKSASAGLELLNLIEY